MPVATPATQTQVATGTPPRAFLDVRDLRVQFATDDGVVRAVDGLSFTVERGQVLGIVGESGSGKSVTSLAVMGLHTGPRVQISGEVWLDGEELLSASSERVRGLRGDKMSMIFQDPLSAMHPFYTVGSQISEAYRIHNDVSRSAARTRVVEMLDRVGIPNPDKRYDDYPHEFSGGMRQRAMIAMSLVCNPALLIADEPTTALDVTVQAQILDLMLDLQREFDSAIVIITHDLGVVAELADDLVVMYGGRCVEQGSVRDIFYRPEMPYSWGLLGSVPRLDRVRSARLEPIPGSPPSLINVPAGCAFNPRCTFKGLVEGDRCRTDNPELLETTAPGQTPGQAPAQAPGHRVRCHIDPPRRQQVWAEQIQPRLS
jgi:peptide/nickel transport system ATP-binding protein